MFNLLCLLMTHWMQNAAELQSTYVATSIINGLCSVMAVTCNLVVILVIVRSPSLHIPSYVLPCNLAISDLGVGLVVQPLYIAVPIEQLKEEVDLSCKLGAAYKLIAICFGALSFFYFYRHQHGSLSRSVSCKQIPQHCDLKRAKLVVVSLWLVAITLMIIDLFITIAYYMIAMIVMSCCLLFSSCNYIAIGRMLQRRHARVQAHNHIQIGQQHRNTFNIGRYKKTVTTMMYVYGAFLLCYLTYLCFTITRIYFGHTSTMQGVNLIASTIVLSNSTLNPFLYYWRIPEVRLQIKQLFGYGATRRRSTRNLEL